MTTSWNAERRSRIGKGKYSRAREWLRGSYNRLIALHGKLLAKNLATSQLDLDIQDLINRVSAFRLDTYRKSSKELVAEGDLIMEFINKRIIFQLDSEFPN